MILYGFEFNIIKYIGVEKMDNHMTLRKMRLITDAELDLAYAAGLLRKEALEHGKYYRGFCRNAEVARWHAGKGVFIHMRTKYGHRFAEHIRHPHDDRHYDVFIALEAATPVESEVVDDEAFNK
jgi:hypothetical protein